MSSFKRVFWACMKNHVVGLLAQILEIMVLDDRARYLTRIVVLSEFLKILSTGKC